MRVLIEGYAAARAAARISEPEIEQLKALVREMEDSVRVRDDSSAPRFAVANTAFHRIILSAAASDRLEAVAQIVIEAPLALRTFVKYTQNQLMRSINQHQDLISAFEARDSAWANSVMSSHIQGAFHVLALDRLRQPANSNLTKNTL